MTEPIIINGVGVSECCYFERENAPYYCTLYENECDAQNCYFQRLKRKEQECEKYKKYIESIKARINSYKEMCNDFCDCNKKCCTSCFIGGAIELGEDIEVDIERIEE